MSASAPPVPAGHRPHTPLYVTLVALVVIALPMAIAQSRSGAFLPHLYCYLANGPLVWTHVTSDFLIGISYVAISATLLYIVRRSEGSVPFGWMVLSFGLFIIACGATHFMEVLTIWKPVYWISAAFKVVTAAASVSTAIALPLLSARILHQLSEAKASATRRQQLEHANTQLERLYRELREADRLKDSFIAQSAAEIGDWSWDLRTGKTLWSEPVRRMHGHEPGRYEGRYEADIANILPEDVPLIDAAVKRALSGHDYEVEYRIVHPDGSLHWADARGRLLRNEQGEPERLIGICLDVTRRKANEEALLRTEKLAAAGRLAATVAHEINNPLEAVMNLVFLARNTEGDNRAILEQADRQLARVSAIARQTLAFYRDTSSPSNVVLSDLVDDVLDSYGAKIKTKNLEIEKIVHAPIALFLRRGDLYQVIANLVSNAIDASQADGQIMVRIETMHQDKVAIEISDEGEGIPPAIARRLFEPFFTTKKEFGTGLGLWVSRRLVEQMGGTLTFNSDTNPHSPGTTFRIELPIGQSAAVA